MRSRCPPPRHPLLPYPYHLSILFSLSWPASQTIPARCVKLTKEGLLRTSARCTKKLEKDEAGNGERTRGSLGYRRERLIRPPRANAPTRPLEEPTPKRSDEKRDGKKEKREYSGLRVSVRVCGGGRGGSWLASFMPLHSLFFPFFRLLQDTWRGRGGINA